MGARCLGSRWRAWSGLACAVLLLSGEVATAAILRSPRPTARPAAPITRWTKVQTSGWRADMPLGWKESAKLRSDPKRKYLSKWDYLSPNKSFRLRVKIRPDQGLAWKELTKATFEKLVKRLPTFKLIRARSAKLGGRETFYLFGSVKLKRKVKTHDYLIFRMLVRFPQRKLRVTMTFLTADERVDELLKVVQRFTDSFELLNPNVVAKAAPRAPAPRGRR